SSATGGLIANWVKRTRFRTRSAKRQNSGVSPVGCVRVVREGPVRILMHLAGKGEVHGRETETGSSRSRWGHRGGGLDERTQGPRWRFLLRHLQKEVSRRRRVERDELVHWGGR